jgi:NADH dehydrogenase
MAGLLVSKKPPTGKTKLSEWLTANADKVGVQYASELGRHFK